MALKVIGAGWGRTGTESLKKALEILDFGKCYHAFELMKDAKRVVYWEQLIRGEKPDYEKLFDGFQSAVDFPTAAFYKELMQQYPDAKVILSYRDAENWYESARKTILKGLPGIVVFIIQFFGNFNKNLRFFPRIYYNIGMGFLMGTFFKGKSKDKAFMLKLYNDWVEEVKKQVPKEKLLVFEAREGWGPLCNFLGVPVPSVPYPKSNDGVKFKDRLSVKNILKEFGSRSQ